ncbi:MAG: bifunctional riboflavin kinase/FAD synthetase [FCB group bacterium]|nr:bifunctional riboflavin kinase/FAD synthetase [FCB group bacterium]
MKIFDNAIDLVPRDEDSIVTVGTFDGIHLGHKQLISRVVESGSPSTVVTFYPHPQMVVARPGGEFKLLTPPAEKVIELSALGMERLIVLRFDREMMNMPADKFLREIIIEKIGLRKMIIGHDHAFGKNRAGNRNFVIKKSAELGFEVEIVPPYIIKDKVVSSTIIRHALEAGEVELAAEYLGHRYTISGWVVKGDARGASLGYPTANINVNSPVKLLPYNGVYAVIVDLLGEKRPGMLYIGSRPTYGAKDLTVEAFILDWQGNLYGEELIIEFISRLRGDIRFPSETELIKAIKQDEENARKLFQKIDI